MHYNEAPPRGRGQESAAACLLRSGRVSRAFLRVLHTLQILACLARALRCGSLRVSLVLVSLVPALGSALTMSIESPRRAEGSITTLSSVACSAGRLSTKKTRPISDETGRAAERGFAWLSVDRAFLGGDAILADVHD